MIGWMEPVSEAITRKTLALLPVQSVLLGILLVLLVVVALAGAGLAVAEGAALHVAAGDVVSASATLRSSCEPPHHFQRASLGDGDAGQFLRRIDHRCLCLQGRSAALKALADELGKLAVES